MITAFILLGVLGGQEILFIAIIILILFGGKKIPELMRSLGKGVSEYNKAVNSMKDQINNIEKDVNVDSNQGNNVDDKTTKNEDPSKDENVTNSNTINADNQKPSDENITSPDVPNDIK